MAVFSMGGKEYELAFTTYAMRKMEEIHGDAQEGMEAFRKNRKNVKLVGEMFAIMANAARHARKQPEDVKPEDIDNLTLKGLETLSQILNATMEESLYTETAFGNESDDESCDLYMQQIEAEKNAQTGEG